MSSPTKNFADFISKLVSNLDNKKYQTTSSLYEVIKEIDRLPNDVRKKHIKDIEKIVVTIQNLGDPQTKLSQNQIDKLVSVLNFDIKEEGIKEEPINNMHLKLSKDDIMVETTRQLLVNLNENMLSSNVTNHVLEYLDIINMILLENDEKYGKFYDDIMLVLMEQGWKKDHGFMREPNKIKIGEELDRILILYTF